MRRIASQLDIPACCRKGNVAPDGNGVIHICKCRLNITAVYMGGMTGTINGETRIPLQYQILIDIDLPPQNRIFQHQRIFEHNGGIAGGITNIDNRAARFAADDNLFETVLQVLNLGIAEMHRIIWVQALVVVIPEENRTCRIEGRKGQQRARTAQSLIDLNIVGKYGDVVARCINGIGNGLFAAQGADAGSAPFGSGHPDVCNNLHVPGGDKGDILSLAACNPQGVRIDYDGQRAVEEIAVSLADFVTGHNAETAPGGLNVWTVCATQHLVVGNVGGNVVSLDIGGFYLPCGLIHHELALTHGPVNLGIDACAHRPPTDGRRVVDQSPLRHLDRDIAVTGDTHSGGQSDVPILRGQGHIAARSAHIGIQGYDSPGAAGIEADITAGCGNTLIRSDDGTVEGLQRNTACGPLIDLQEVQIVNIFNGDVT